jgi:hypothetical protein
MSLFRGNELILKQGVYKEAKSSAKEKTSFRREEVVLKQGVHSGAKS